MLDAKGKDGWELATAFSDGSGGVVFVFKRSGRAW
jgi:hypothetical protein